MLFDQTYNSFLEIINKLQEEKVNLIQIRYKEFNKKTVYNGDFDYLLSKEDEGSFLNILFEVCKKNNTSFTINRRKYGKLNILLQKDDGSDSIELDIWNALEVKDKSKKMYYIFFNKIEKFVDNFKLKRDIEAVYYLSHIYTKKKDIQNPEVKLRLKYYIDILGYDFNEIKNILQNILNGDSIDTYIDNVLKILQENDLYNYKDSEQNKYKFLKAYYNFKKSYIEYIKIIPFIGPDGVGKTTLIESIENQYRQKARYFRFKKLFRKSIIYNFIYFFKKRLNKNIDKNQLDDINNRVVVFSALCSYPILLIKSFLFKKYYLSDRYFSDFIFKNLRFKDKKVYLDENWKSILNITPNIHWLVHLDANTNDILERKDELSKDAINFYKDKVFEIYLNKKPFIYSYINTSNSLENSENQIKYIIKKLPKVLR